MENPFETGHIKNYLLFYTGVVAIVILFFIATTLFDEEKPKITKKIFKTKPLPKQINKEKNNTAHATTFKFKLLKETY